MSDARLHDASARERVRGSGASRAGDGFDRDTSLVVRAGAGSGKTRALVDRVVALVRSGVAIERIAAITFTVRAAGEMRVRLFETLRALAAELGSAPDADEAAVELARVRDAADRVEDLFVDTIHTFCRSLLAERPYEAGLPPDFRIVDDREELEMRQHFWRRHLDRHLEDDPNAAAYWDALGLEPTTLHGFFGERCRHEDLRLAPGRSDPPDLSDVVERVQAWLGTVLRATPEAAADRDRLIDVFRRMERYRRLVGLDTPARQAEWLEAIDRLVKDDGSIADLRVRVWEGYGEAAEAMLASLRGKAEDPVVEPLGAFVTTHVRPVLTRWKEYVYGEVGRFVDEAVDAYALWRCSEGLLTFQDLLLRTADLLRSSAEARHHFRRRYRYLLIDEFQDTDPVQAEILFLLTADDPDVTDWTAARPVAGSVFLVGDDKQSIYRFRRADVQVFRQAQQLIERSGGDTLRFTSNFRSEERLCVWINESLRPAFGDEEPFQADWEDLHPVVPATRTVSPVALLDLDKVWRNTGQGIARQEAPRIADAIERLVGGAALPASGGEAVGLDGAPPGFGDIMILLRTARHAVEYTREFERRGIPYVASGGKALGREPAVRAVLDLLEAALDTDDPVRLLAVLRGPFVGASDDELRRFRAIGGRFAAEGVDQAPLASDTFASIRDGIRLVSAVRRLFTTLPPGEAMANLLGEAGLLAGMAVRPEGSSAAGALLRLLTIARDLDGQGAGWLELVDELRRIDAGELDMESQTIEAGGPAVRLMTVHQAKGLEARVVFLAFPVQPRPQPVDFHVDRGGGSPVIYLPCRDGRREIARPVGWDEAQEAERRFAAAEDVRLAYVAATRARELVVLSRYPEKGDGPWSPLYATLSNIPVLAPGAPRDDGAALDRAGLSHEAIMARLERAQDGLARAALPTYGRTSVTGGSEDEGGDPFEAETEGLGRGYGRAVHRLFQLLVERRSDPMGPDGLRRAARRFVEEETEARGGDLDDRASRAVEATEGFAPSALWSEMAIASRVYCELPLVSRTEESERPTLVSGVIDLLYRTADGWVIVDYKTEGGSPEDLRRRHAAQLQAYRRYWSALSGEPVVRTLIWPAVPGADEAVICG